MNEEVISKLNEMDGKLDQVITWQAVHSKGHEALDRDVEEVKGSLYENPGGLRARVDTLWNCKKDISKRKEFWKHVLSIVIAAIIIAVIMWFIGLYKGN